MFLDYWQALTCISSTTAEKVCENKCGPTIALNSATGLEIYETDAGVALKYETNSNKNTAAVGPACK
jgi:hypothetical protein